MIAHAVWLDDREVELVRQTGTAVTHCLCSNMKLASGPARVGYYRAQGVTVALGIDDVTGTLEEGKDGDVVMVDLSAIHFVPLLHGSDFNAPAHLVFSANSRDVTNVWVQGKRLVQDRRVTTVDLPSVIARAQAAAEELFERRRPLVGHTPSPRNVLGKEL